MDSTATNPAEAPPGASMFDESTYIMAFAVMLPMSYLFFGWWGAAAAVAVIFIIYLSTPFGRDLVLAVFCCRRRPRRPASSGLFFVGAGGRGMDPAAIAALPAPFAFKRDVQAGEGWAQCAICLGLVGAGETVRRLPACGHLFHADCVDEWLRSHPTCPLCRAAVRGGAAARLPV